MKWKIDNPKVIGRGIKSDHAEETVDPENYKERIRDNDTVENTALRKSFTSEVKAVDEDKRIVEFTISTARRDRDGDIIDPKGWNLSDYKKNPVVLWGHNPSIPPIGRAKEIWMDNGKLKANAEFADLDIDPSGFSDTIYRMLKAGYLKATSVGFLPRELEFIKEQDDNSDEIYITGLKFTKQDLLEFSVVGVPSNADALVSDKDINVKPYKDFLEQALDEYSTYKDTLLVPKDTAAEVYNKIKNSTKLKGSDMTDTKEFDEGVTGGDTESKEDQDLDTKDTDTKNTEEVTTSEGKGEDDEDLETLLKRVKELLAKDVEEDKQEVGNTEEKDSELLEANVAEAKHSVTITIGDSAIKMESDDQDFLKELFQLHMKTTDYTERDTTGTEEKEHEQEEAETDEVTKDVDDDDIDFNGLDPESLSEIVKETITEELKSIQGKV